MASQWRHYRLIITRRTSPIGVKSIQSDWTDLAGVYPAPELGQWGMTFSPEPVQPQWRHLASPRRTHRSSMAATGRIHPHSFVLVSFSCVSAGLVGVLMGVDDVSSRHFAGLN